MNTRSASRRVRGTPLRFLALVPIVMTVATCSLAAPNDIKDLKVDNETTLQIALVVNDQSITKIDPKSGPISISVASLPPLPWVVEARTTGGRSILRLPVEAQDVSTANRGSEVQMRGAAARAELSCGVLDIWVGPPIAGPSPGRGQPGDCDP